MSYVLFAFRFDFLRENIACKFIGSLAVSDMIGGGGAFLEVAWNTTALSLPLTSNLLCRIMLFCTCLSALGNFYSYLLMTGDRFMFVERPLRYVSLVTERRAILGIIIIWVVNLVQTITMIRWDLDVNPEYSCNWMNDNITLANQIFLKKFFQKFLNS